MSYPRFKVGLPSTGDNSTTMGETKIEDPDVAGTYTTDDRGRVTLGSDYANQELFVAAERKDKE